MKVLQPYIHVELKDRETKAGIIVADEQEQEPNKKECVVITPYETCEAYKEGDVLILRSGAQLTAYKTTDNEELFFVSETDIIAVNP